MVETDPVGQAKLSINNFEPIVRNRVSDAITCVRIERRQGADDGTSVILGYRRSIQREITRPFIHVLHIDRKRLFRTETTTVCGSDRQLNRRHLFMVQADPIDQSKLTIDDFEPVIRNSVRD